jgi:hypothetical protein
MDITDFWLVGNNLFLCRRIHEFFNAKNMQSHRD